MQKTEFQINGYLYRRGNDNSSWSNRYVTLSTDTGAMKLYMEKSGKRTIKGQLNIKKSVFSEISSDQAGRQFAFELVSDELKGKSEDAVLILAAPDQDQYDEWKKSISVCFTIRDSRRRKSTMSEGTSSMSSSMTDVKAAVQSEPSYPSSEVSIEADAISNNKLPENELTSISSNAPTPEVTSSQSSTEEVQVSADVVDSIPNEKQSDSSLRKINPAGLEKQLSMATTEATAQPQPHRVNSEDEVDRSIRNAAMNAQQNVELTAAAPIDTPARPRPSVELYRKTSVKFEENPLTVTIDSPLPSPAISRTPFATVPNVVAPAAVSAVSPLSKIFGESPAGDDSILGTNESEMSSEMNSPFPPGKSAVSQKLEKKLARMSFKKPNFKNLLNDNGLDEQMKQELEIAAEVKQGTVVPRPSIVKKEKEPEVPVRTPLPPRQLSVHVRPTEPVREGYLQKLDSSSLNDLGEDSWLDQFASLQVNTGELKLYAEIGGRRILRGSMNVNQYIARGIDYVFYGKVFAAELVVQNEGGSPSEEAAAVFAMEDLEKYSYWMISFQDAKDMYLEEKHRQEELLRQEEEAEERKRQEEEEKMRHAAADASMAESKNNEHRRSFRPFEGGSTIAFAGLDDIEGIQHVHYTGSDSNRSSPTLSDNGAAQMPEYLQSPMSPVPMPLPLPTGEMKTVMSSNRLLSSANLATPLAKAGIALTERVPTSSNMRSLERQPSHRGMPVDGDSHDFLMQRQRSHSAAPDLEPSYHHPLAAIFNPVDASHGAPHTSLRMDEDNSPLDLMSPNTAMIMQQMFIPEVENLTLEFSKIHYPMERLARRIKIWYCSSGFSISSEKEVENFVRELRNTDDKVLHAFSHEKFAYLNDWAKLLEMLRKYEEHSAQDPRTHANKAAQTPEEAELNGHFAFILKGKTKGDERGPAYPVVNVSLNESLDIEPLARKLASEFSISESVVSTKLLGMLAKKDSALANGFKMLKEDMTFAEDLVLYQEEVIEHMWQSYTALKSLIEQKDAVINQLYSQLSEAQEKYRSMQLGTDAHHTSGVSHSTTIIKKLGGDVPDSQDVKVIADREFNNADRDGDGRISREEWRKWIEDKHNLIQEHNHVKSMLMEEIRILRRSMNPQSQQTFEELRRSEEIRNRVEEELIRAQIANDGLRDDLFSISVRLKDVEQEKMMLESDWKEKFEAMKKENDELKKKLVDAEQDVEDLKAKQQSAPTPLTPLRLENQSTPHGYGYSSFSPMQFPSYSAPRGVSLNPYAYSIAEDRVLAGGDASVMGGIALDNSSMANMSQLGSGGGGGVGDNFGALDLHTIANSDVGSENHAFAQSQQQHLLYGAPVLAHPAMLLLQQQQFLIQQQQQQLQQASQLLASSSSVVSNNNSNPAASSSPPQLQSSSSSVPLVLETLPRRSFTNANASTSILSTPVSNDLDLYAGSAGGGSAPYEFRSPDEDDEYLHQQFVQHQQLQQQAQQQYGHHHVDEMYNEAKGGDMHGGDLPFPLAHSKPPQHQQMHHHVTMNATTSSNNSHSSHDHLHRTGSNGRGSAPVSIGQQMQQAAQQPNVVYGGATRSIDHPLRNALRHEVRRRGNPVALPPTSASKPNSRARSPLGGENSPERMRTSSPPSARTPAGGNMGQQTPTTPSYAAPLVKRSGVTTQMGNHGAGQISQYSASLPVTPKTPLSSTSYHHHATSAMMDDGRVGNSSGSGVRPGSPQRFMQGTNSWKKKAIPSDRMAQENIIMRASNWK